MQKALVIDITDEDSPYLTGSRNFVLYNSPNSQVSFDNILMTSPILLQEAKWISTGGPWGGIGYDVRIDPINPNLMYVTDQWAGNHKSTNGGATWYSNSNGIESVFGSTGQSVPIFCLTIDPNNTNNVWCGTFNKRGVYRSTDKGEHWEKKIKGISDYPCGVTFRGFGIRPGNSDVVFCGVEIPCCPDKIPEGKVAASRGKIFKTTNFGENWREVLDSDALVRHILINPENPDIMYASTGIFDRDCVKEEGVWKSTDGGETWFHANSGLTDLTVCGLFMDTRNPDILWACTGREEMFGGDSTGEIFTTSDGGVSWIKVFPKFNQTVWVIDSITTSGSNSNIIYAASEGTFYFSHDGGDSWSKSHYNIPGVYTGIPVGIATHPNDENTIFINSYSGGVFESNDGGMTWLPKNIGYTGAEMNDIIINPNNSKVVLATGISGIAKSNDGGMSWEGAGNCSIGALGFGIGPIGEQTVLEMNHQDNNNYLCGASYGTHLLKTTDKFNWIVVHDFRDNGVPLNHGIGDIEYANNNGDIVYVGIRYRTLPLIIDRPHHYDPDIVSYGMFKSLDGSDSWNQIINGLDETTQNIQTITVHPTNPDIVYCGVYGFGIYKTTDGGDYWSAANEGLISYLIASIAIDPNNPDVIYAGAEDGGLYKSLNGGDTWEVSVLGMDPEASIRSIVIDPTDSQIIYASDWHTGVYRSNDGGERWWPLNEGLTQRSVQKLAISSDGGTLYAATQGSGVFRLSFENGGPIVQYIHPNNSVMMGMRKEEQQKFIVGAIDYNGDNLNYTWYLDGSHISEVNIPEYSLDTSTLTEGSYALRCDITDGEFIESVLWNVEYRTNILPPTNIVVSDTPNDNGNSIEMSWSLSEDDEFITHYNIFRSKNPELTEPINLESFDSLEALISAEETATILIASVPKGQDTFTDSSIPVNNVNYYYWVQAVSQDGSSEKVAAENILTVIDDYPSVFKVNAPYPNPFNPTTTIQYEIPENRRVTLVVYDILGRKVAVLQDGTVNAGVYEAVWDGKDQFGATVGSGIYLYKLFAGQETAQGKVLFLR